VTRQLTGHALTRPRASKIVNKNKQASTTMNNPIAPCGMNCEICLAYLRTKNHCPGCRESDENKSKSCLNCKIKNCNELRNNNHEYCFSCKHYPCERIKHLDKRYKTKYGMSMTENLEAIKKNGIKEFIKTEKKRWACPKCKATICVHKDYCLNCNTQNKKKKYVK
jgi:hypothetical protein